MFAPTVAEEAMATAVANLEAAAARFDEATAQVLVERAEVKRQAEALETATAALLRRSDESATKDDRA
jgi:hypothetical protein